MRSIAVGLFFLVLAGMSMAGQPESYSTRVSGIPEGFEGLLEPQRTLVDLYFGGRFLLATMAEFTDAEITFLAPEEIVAAVGGWVDVQEATRLLSVPLAANADRICTGAEEPLCGQMIPEQISVIFDVARFRGDLFIAPSVLQATAADRAQFLPDGDSSDITAVQSVNFLYSGSSDSDIDNYSVYGRSRIGRNDKFVFADAYSTDIESLLVDDLGYHHGFRAHAVDIGYFNQDPAQLRTVGRDLLLGVRLGSSLDHRADLSGITASPINLFLINRSRVDIFREGRLIDSSFYEAGHQRLDTSRFPAGAYLLDIVITTPNGTQTREQQLFVKSSLFAPPGIPQWFVEVGRPAQRSNAQTLPVLQDDLRVRGGWRWKQKPWLGLGVAAAGTQDQAVAEFALGVLLDRIESTVELLAGTSGMRGLNARAVSRWSGGSLSFNSQYLDMDSDEVNALLSRDRLEIYSLSLTQRVRDMLVSLTSTASQVGDAEQVSRHNLRLSRVFSVGGGNRIQLSLNIGSENDVGQLGFGLQWTGGTSSSVYGVVHDQLRSENAAAADVITTSAYQRFQGQSNGGADWNLNLEARHDDFGQRLSVDAEQRGRRGATRASVAHALGETDSSTQYALGHTSMLTLGPAQKLSWGGARPSTSAVVVQLENDSEGTVDVLVDGRRAVTSPIRQTAFPIPLAPYREYRLSVRDRGDSLLSFDAAEQVAVLYPGDVKLLRWRVDTLKVLLARIVYERRDCLTGRSLCMRTWMPVANTRFDGAQGWAESSANGFLQAEVRESARGLSATVNGRRCEVDLSETVDSQGVLRSERLICRFADDQPGNATPSRP